MFLCNNHQSISASQTLKGGGFPRQMPCKGQLGFLSFSKLMLFKEMTGVGRTQMTCVQPMDPKL